MNHLSDEALQALADGNEVPDAEHVACCAKCQALLAEYRALFSGLEKLEVAPPPPRFTAQVMARVEAREAQLAHQRRLAFLTFAAGALVAFGCFALAGGGIWARQLSALGSSAFTLARLGQVLVDVLRPVLGAFHLQLTAIAAVASIATLLTLHRTLVPRGQAA